VPNTTTNPNTISSVDEGADVGKDGETSVTEDYGTPAPHEFTGKIVKVTIDVKETKQADASGGEPDSPADRLQQGLGGLSNHPA
jgi:hypothetical protein